MNAVVLASGLLEGGRHGAARRSSASGGEVITLLSICGLTHRQAYLDIFVVAVLGPIAALIAVLALGSAFGAF